VRIDVFDVHVDALADAHAIQRRVRMVGRAHIQAPQHIEAVNREGRAKKSPGRPLWFENGGRRCQPEGEEGVDSDRELMVEDAHSILDGLWRIARLAQDAVESLDGQIEDEELDGIEEAAKVREAIERVQALSLEVSE
jgi:hypothetical protein